MHTSVLLEESIEGLNIKKNGIYIDCTLGLGGHSQEILKRLKEGFLFCFEQDLDAINYAKERLKGYKNFEIIYSNFQNIKSELEKRNIKKVDGILFDLGVSSLQFDTGERGFSYRFEADLDMRMDQNSEISAKYIVNNYTFNDLRYIFSNYGEERFSKEIARNIEKKRTVKPIETTFELIEIIKEVLPERVKREKGHPAKKVFQALRIAVNDELKVFEIALNDSCDLLNSKGRIAVISFHSLEDRLCKTVFAQKSTVNLPDKLPINNIPDADYKIITKKPIIPTDFEQKENKRSHSAKLRILEKN